MNFLLVLLSIISFTSVFSAQLSRINPMSDSDYCEKLVEAVKKEDQCAIESLYNLPHGTETIERLLLRKKLNPNEQGTQKEHALIHWAARANNADILKVLCADTRTNKDIENKNGCTALSFAVAQAKVPATKALLDAGANPNILNEAYNTSLHTAIKGYFAMNSSYKDNYFKIIELLIGNPKTSVNNGDYQGRTSLHYAVLGRCKKLIKLLLGCKAIDRNIKDLAKKTALDYAREIGTSELIELLSGSEKK